MNDNEAPLESNNSRLENHQEESEKESPSNKKLPENNQKIESNAGRDNNFWGDIFQGIINGGLNLFSNFVLIFKPTFNVQNPFNAQHRRFIRYVAAGVYATFVIGGFIKLWVEGYASPFTLSLLITGGVLLSLTCCYYAYFWEPSHIPPPKDSPVKPEDPQDSRFWPNPNARDAERDEYRFLAARQRYKEEYEQELASIEERRERYKHECDQYEQELKQYEQYEKQRNKILRQANLRRWFAAVLMVGIPFLVAAGVYIWWKAPTNTIVAFADYYGADPSEVNQLNEFALEELKSDPRNKQKKDIVIKSIKESFEEEEDAIYAGNLRRATIIIWGWIYEKTSHTIFSLLEPPLDFSNTAKRFEERLEKKLEVEEIEEIDWSRLGFSHNVQNLKEVDFETEFNLGNEISYLVNFTSGLAHYKAELWQSAIDRFNTALKDIERVKKRKSELDQSIVYFYRSNAYFYNAYFSKTKDGYNSAINGFNKAIELIPESSLAFRDWVTRDRSNPDSKRINHGVVFANYKVSQHEPELNRSDDEEIVCGNRERDSHVIIGNSPLQLRAYLARVYYNRGVSYAIIGNTDKAFDDYVKAFQLDPEMDELCIGLGITYASQGNYGSAIKSLDQAISVNPEDALAHNNLGNIYASQSQAQHTSQEYQQEKYQQAIQEYTKAIQLKPGFAEAYYNRARIYLTRKGNTNEASSTWDFNKAVELNPSFEDVYYYGRGEDYLARKEYYQSFKDFKKVIELNPSFAEAYYRLGEIELSCGDFLSENRLCIRANWLSNEFYTSEIILEYFNKAIELNPDLKTKVNSTLSKAYYELGESLFSTKDFDAAISSFNKAIEHNPEFATKLKPTLAEAYYQVGLAYLEQNECERAIENYDQAIRLKPGYADAYSDRGLCLTVLNKNEQGLENFNQAIQLAPDNAVIYNNRGLSFLQQGLNDQAISDFNRALELDPGFAHAYLNRGTAYRVLGNESEAVKNFQKADTLIPAQSPLRSSVEQALGIVSASSVTTPNSSDSSSRGSNATTPNSSTQPSSSSGSRSGGSNRRRNSKRR